MESPAHSEPAVSWPTRNAGEDDLPDVVHTWLSSFRNSKWAGTIPNNLFNEVQARAIRQLFDRGATVTCCVNPLRPEQVLGWICTETTRKGEPVVHYVFVKPSVRQHGIARTLFAATGIDPKSHFAYTHRTDDAAYFPGGMFAPMIARRKRG
jgi:hypothetical protein